MAGLLLVAGGAALVLLAVDGHGRDSAAEARAHVPPPQAASGDAPRAPVSARSTASTVVIATASSSAGPAASASGPSASASASSSARPASSAPPGAAGGLSVHFAAGGIVLPKDEITRLVGHAAELRKDVNKVVVEGFADEPGTDDKAIALARRRAILARQLLTEVGIDPERLSIAVVDVASEPSLAGSVRVRVKEAK